nr:MAG TPA: CreA protein [Caudoviricetes sp.]
MPSLGHVTQFPVERCGRSCCCYYTDFPTICQPSGENLFESEFTALPPLKSYHVQKIISTKRKNFVYFSN